MCVCVCVCVCVQIQARVQVIRQRLQSDPQFRAAYLRQVAKEIQLEQALESKLAQAGKNREAKVCVCVCVCVWAHVCVCVCVCCD